MIEIFVPCNFCFFGQKIPPKTARVPFSKFWMMTFFFHCWIKFWITGWFLLLKHHLFRRRSIKDGFHDFINFIPTFFVIWFLRGTSTLPNPGLKHNLEELPQTVGSQEASLPLETRCASWHGRRFPKHGSMGRFFAGAWARERFGAWVIYTYILPSSGSPRFLSTSPSKRFSHRQRFFFFLQLVAGRCAELFEKKHIFT